MLLESRIKKVIGRLRANASLPVAIELWNGERYELSPAPTVTLRIPSASALRYFANPDLATLGEAYVEGHVDVEGPIGDALRAAEGFSRQLGEAKKGRLPLLRNLHTRKTDAASIQYHYDVSNDFYALWLDRNMVYSCAYFKTGDESIDVAQEQKLDHICRKLRLRPGEKLLDIGCGWGALGGQALRRGRDRNHAVAQPARARQPAHRRRWTGGALPRAAAGLPRRPGRRDLRQDLLGGHVRARRPQ